MNTPKLKVIPLIEHGQDGRMWSVLDMLRRAITDLEALKDAKYNKAIILFLDDEDSHFITSFCQAGMTRSEIVALLEVMKLRFLRGLVGDEDA